MKKVAIVSALCVAMLIAYAYAARMYSVNETISLTITSAGDTAQVLTITPTVELDSHNYIDTIGDSVVQWTSPLYAVRLRVDSATGSAYLCSLYVNGTKRAFTFTRATGLTIPYAVDSFVAVINALAGVTDTIEAEDSGTYVYIRNKFSSEHYQDSTKARFAVARGTSAARDLKIHFDTAAITTVAMICDSMADTINGRTGIKTLLTATSEDTVYRITAKQKGLAFTFLGVDAAQDTATTQLNVTSYSSVTDTVWLGPTSEIGDRAEWDATSILFKATITPRNATADTIGHAGFLDSASCQIYTVSEVDDSWFLLDSFVGDTVGASNLSKRIIKTGLTSGAGTDTLFKGPLVAIIRIVDSTSDTTKATANQYRFKAEWQLK